MKRVTNRLAAVETIFNHRALAIRKGLRDWEKDNNYKKEKYYDKTYLWAIVEELTILNTTKPITNNPCEEVYFFPGDKQPETVEEGVELRTSKIYDTLKKAIADNIKEEECTKCFRLKYFNCVNVFLTRKAAKEHLAKHSNLYTNASVIPMFPIENKEIDEIRHLFYHLGENIPDVQSVWEENQNIKVLEGTVEALKRQVKLLEGNLVECDKEKSELAEENKLLTQAITVKQKKAKK